MTMTTTTTRAKRFGHLRANADESTVITGAQRRAHQRHLYSEYFKPEDVEKLALDPKSGISSQNHLKTVSMHCRFIGRHDEGIRVAFDDELFKYSSVYEGIVVSFGKATMMSGSAPSFEHDLRWIFLNVNTVVYFFKPRVGSILRGKVNNRTSTYFVGCLIHEVFNAEVQIDEDEPGIYEEIGLMDEIEFEVTNVRFNSDTVDIKGKLIGAISHHPINETEAERATLEEVDETHSSNNSDASTDGVDEGVDEEEDAVGKDDEEANAGRATLEEVDETRASSSDEADEAESPSAPKVTNYSAPDASLKNPSAHTPLTEQFAGVKKLTQFQKTQTLLSFLEENKKKMKDKSLADASVVENGDAIPELILEKKLQRESEGSLNSEEKVVGAETSASFDDDDDFEPPVKKKRKKLKTSEWM